MNLKTLVEQINGECLNTFIDGTINGVKIDTRKLCPGDIFLAISGERHNSHEYIKDIINNKLCAIIVSEDIKIETNIPIIKVDDTLKTLLIIGNIYRNYYNPIVIGITGSVGKSTTKELISLILSTKYNVLTSEGNLNNHIGVPLTLTKLNDSYDYCVVEMGMNHTGEISKLSKCCNPNIGIITNIGTSHIGNLKSINNIFLAKLEILDGMDGNSSLVINGDDLYLRRVKNSIKCGISDYNDLQAFNIKTDSNVLEFDVKLDKIYHVVFNIPNESYIGNLMLAIKVGLMNNIEMEEIINRIRLFKQMDRRMNITKLKYNNILIDDTYNASLESVASGLNLIEKYTLSKMIILGDILELGEFSKKIHLKINRQLKDIKDSTVLLVGEYTKYISGVHFNNNDDLIKYLDNQEIKNTVIYIKGSRKMRLDEVSINIYNRYC